MIMSEAELGLAAKSPGIMVLPEEWEAGDLLSEYFPISDQVLEVEVTPNRPDCLSMRGLAREIAAITGRRLSRRTCTSGIPWGDRAVDRGHMPSRCTTPTCARAMPDASSGASPSANRRCG